MMTGRQKYGWDLRMLAAGVALLLAPVLASGQQDLPDKPDLIRVTVDHSDDGVLIQWEASTDNDIEFYHLYKMNDRTGQRIFSFSANTLEYKHMTSGLENLACWKTTNTGPWPSAWNLIPASLPLPSTGPGMKVGRERFLATGSSEGWQAVHFSS